MPAEVGLLADHREPGRGDVVAGRSIELAAAGHGSPDRVHDLLSPREQPKRAADVFHSAQAAIRA